MPTPLTSIEEFLNTVRGAKHNPNLEPWLGTLALDLTRKGYMVCQPYRDKPTVSKLCFVRIMFQLQIFSKPEATAKPQFPSI